MSRYTTELRYIVESGYDLGLSEYEIISEEYRTKLNKKILDHYYFYEIGFETASKFKHYLNTTMNEIMPYYNQLLKSELLEINPLLTFERKKNLSKNVDSQTLEDLKNNITKEQDSTTTDSLTNDSTLDNTSTSNTDDTQNVKDEGTENNEVNSSKTNTSTQSSENKDIFSDTPQSLITDTDIQANVYATEMRIKNESNTIDESETLSNKDSRVKFNDTTSTSNSSNQTSSNSSSSSNTDSTSIYDNDESVSNISDNKHNTTLSETNIITENGFEISLSDLLLRYRETFLNVDMMIIDDLKDLFMMIY